MRTGRIFAVLLAAAGPASSQAIKPERLADFMLERTVALAGETHHVQGIDLDGETLWVTSVDAPRRKGYLQAFGLASGALRRTVEVGQGLRFHPGGMALDGDSLWLPAAEYRRDSSAVIQKRNRKTLELEAQFEVRDHIGCVAVAGAEVIGGNWDSKEFYVWDKSGREIRKVANPTDNRYQDLKYVAGRLVASGVRSEGAGAIDWLEYPSLKLVRRITVGKTSRGALYTREGMALSGGRLYLLPEDAPSRLFVFPITR